jgi:hypothetical protein
MEFILAPLILIIIVTAWAAQEDTIGSDTAGVLITIELTVFAALIVWSIFAVTGPHTFIGKRLQARQERIAFQRAVGKDRENHDNHNAHH